MSRRSISRLFVRRTVFLLAGGAVGAAFLVLGSALGAALGTDEALVAPAFVVTVLLMMVGAGLLPGVREVQVAGAEALLGVPDEAVATPEPMRWDHRWRTALWTLVHQVAGLVSGLILLISGMMIATAMVLAIGGDPLIVPGMDLPSPDGPGEWALALGGLLVALTLGLVAIAGLGLAAAATAPLLLGLVGPDRLQLVEQRLAREREHVRLSRDLHDGVGHSLSAISLQAGAARRTLDAAAAAGSRADPDRLAETMRIIEGLAGRAVSELDHALAVLRRDADDQEHGKAQGARTRADPVAARSPVSPISERDLTDLPNLVADHRSRGMELSAELPNRDWLAAIPAVVSGTAYRICAEGLANAAKHGSAGSVRLLVSEDDDRLEIDLTNPASDEQPGVGHGLAGLREQVLLLGGSLTAGRAGSPPAPGQWQLRVSLPGPDGGTWAESSDR